ncbi:MAG: radical SAM protein [Candidatus Eisenbacteria bacterium]|uniref:Radical SAM protein n=1 Tax=Eiseniibacteriota bacterium TaxID=2212470 RepID=A0A933SD81_UNCEI|nr:radical SAM protein [Candidatus Eisenbacteria bacterium]
MRPEYFDQPCRSALNHVSGMPFEWTLNPYMGCAHRCTFCYVRAFERRADRPSGDAYGRRIRIKPNIAGVLRRELARPSWSRETVVVGAATDPYQPIEGSRRLTRACLEAFVEHANPFGIITRGPLVVRDLDVLAEGSRRAKVAVDVSIPTLDEALWRVTEPGTAPPAQRLRAVRRLADAGIRVRVAMAPLLPGLSDRDDSLANVVRAARDAGAISVWAGLLHLQPGTREHFLDTLGAAWPEERARIETLYAGRAYLPKRASAPVLAHVAELRRASPRRAGAPEPIEPLPPPEPERTFFAEQLGLAL